MHMHCVQLYTAIVVSSLLYGYDTWPMTVANRRRLEAAHHKWLKRILHLSWNDKIKNKSIRYTLQDGAGGYGGTLLGQKDKSGYRPRISHGQREKSQPDIA